MNDKPLSAYERWMVKSNLEYFQNEGLELVVARLRDLLCVALEGGIGYWAAVSFELAPGLEFSDFREGGKFQDPDNYFHPYEIIPTVEGCTLLLHDTTGESDSVPTHPQPWKLNREILAKGLQLMAEKYPKHWNDFITENYDADTGDCFVQLCCFNEIIFG